MPKLTHVYRAQTVSTDVEFYESDNVSPFVATAVSFTVYSHLGQVITSGAGIQDTFLTQKWTATFTIPSSAPVPEYNEKYKIAWVATNASNVIQTALEFFSVRVDGDPINTDSGRMVLAEGKLVDYLVLEDDAPTSIDWRILDYQNVTLDSGSVATSPSRVINGQYVYDLVTMANPLLIPSEGICPYFCEWTANTATGVVVEVHPVYVISTRMYMFIDGVKRMIDKARNYDINPNLRYDDITIANSILDGLARINRTDPTLTNWTTETAPPMIFEWIKKAGAIEALRAQYLAEAVSAFDFQGASVQLNVDRTQGIQAVIDMLETQMQELRKTKKLLVRRSGPGTLGIAISSSVSYTIMSPQSRMAMLRSLYLAR